MKKIIYVAFSFLLLLVMSLPTSMTYAGPINTSGITQIKLANNPLIASQNKKLNVRYSLHRKAIVGAKILNRKGTVRILRRSRLQRRGLHRLYWNGRGRGNRLVPQGTYTLKIAVRDLKTTRVAVRKKRIMVVNELIFFDYFDRPDGLIADNYGHSDPLGKWKVTSQSFYAKDSMGYTNSPVFRAITQKTDFTNFLLKADMKKMDLAIEPWEGLQLFFRYRDADNLYVAGIRNDNQIQLKKKVNGIYTTLGTAPIDGNKLGYWYKMVVMAKGTNIQIYVDGTKYIEANDASLSAGRAGIRTDNIEAYFDNFEVFTQ